MNCSLFQMPFLLKAAFVAFIFAFSSIGNAEAKPSDKCSAEGQKPCPVFYSGPVCDRGLGNLGGICRPCGGEAQRACPAMEQGKQCRGGRKKIEGRCYAACGGPNQKACPKIYPGYPCKGKYEPNGAGICKPCGGANQKSCRVFKAGERCDAGLDEDGNGVCRPCGGQNEPTCSVIKKGTICEAGFGNINGLCRPCGLLNQPACPALEQGRQCEEWTTNRGGVCRPCGTPGTGACRVTDKGEACRPEYDWKMGSSCKETVRSITRAKAAEKFEEMGAEVFLNASSYATELADNPSVKNAISEGETPSDMPDNKLCLGTGGESHRSWTLGIGGGAGVPVGGVEGEAGAAFRCANREGVSDTKWYSAGALSWVAGASAGVGFNLGMWKSDYNDLRGKSHGYVIGLWDIASITPKLAGALQKVKYKGVIAPDVSVGLWFAMEGDGSVGDYQGFTITLGGAAGLGLGKYVRSTTVQRCDYDMDCAIHKWRQVHEGGDDKGQFIDDGVTINVLERDKQRIIVDITKDGETREGLVFVRHTITDKRDYELLDEDDEDITLERICFRHNFKEIKYRAGSGNCDRGISLAVEDDDDAINTLGLWDFEVSGRTLTDEFITQGETFVILRRLGTDELRRYNKVGEDHYRNENGASFRFVSEERGVWISANKETVYQLTKR